MSDPHSWVYVQIYLFFLYAIFELPHRMRNYIWILDAFLLGILPHLSLMMHILQPLTITNLRHLGIIQDLKPPIIHLISLVLKLIHRIIFQLLLRPLHISRSFTTKDRGLLPITFIIELRLLLWVLEQRLHVWRWIKVTCGMKLICEGLFVYSLFLYPNFVISVLWYLGIHAFRVLIEFDVFIVLYLVLIWDDAALFGDAVDGVFECEFCLLGVARVDYPGHLLYLWIAENIGVLRRPLLIWRPFLSIAHYWTRNVWKVIKALYFDWQIRFLAQMDLIE